MKNFSFLIFSLLVMLSVNSFSQAAPVYVPEGTIKIDGDVSDWSGTATLFSDLGAKSPNGDFVDVKQSKVAFNKTHLLFNFKTNAILNEWKPKEDISILQIYFDVDANQNTGCDKLKAYEAKIMGYEFRVEVKVDTSGKISADLYSKSDGFNSKVNSWDSSSDFSAKGSSMEFRIPLDTLNIPNSGVAKVRFLFAEFANSKSGAGYTKIVYPLNFKQLEKDATSEASEEAGSSSSSSIYLLMVIATWIISLLCGFAIVPKAGLGSGVALINIIPFIGQIVFLFILAFNKWPLHDDYNKLEKKIADLENQDQY
ncbi:MAG: hypothetical protein NE330_19830 [Lentisphaeraceae bacterium]|nr:hypothetical protein [Lentisphaeraceae bacterium]